MVQSLRPWIPTLSKWLIKVLLPKFSYLKIPSCYLLKLEVIFSMPELEMIIIFSRSLSLSIFLRVNALT